MFRHFASTSTTKATAEVNMKASFEELESMPGRKGDENSGPTLLTSPRRVASARNCGFIDTNRRAESIASMEFKRSLAPNELDLPAAETLNWNQAAVPALPRTASPTSPKDATEDESAQPTSFAKGVKASLAELRKAKKPTGSEMPPKQLDDQWDTLYDRFMKQKERCKQAIAEREARDQARWDELCYEEEPLPPSTNHKKKIRQWMYAHGFGSSRSEYDEEEEVPKKTMVNWNLPWHILDLYNKMHPEGEDESVSGDSRSFYTDESGSEFDIHA